MLTGIAFPWKVRGLAKSVALPLAFWVCSFSAGGQKTNKSLELILLCTLTCKRFEMLDRNVSYEFNIGLISTIQPLTLVSNKDIKVIFSQSDHYIMLNDLM